MTVVHFLPFWSNTINLSFLPAGELQWAIQDKAVMLTMETEASALQYSGKVTHSRGTRQQIGHRAVKRSRRPQSHGSRSRRLKCATSGHCWKRQLQAEERRNVGQQTQSGAILVSYADDVSYAVRYSTPCWVLRLFAAVVGSKLFRKRATISTMSWAALPRLFSSLRLFHSSSVAIE